MSQNVPIAKPRVPEPGFYPFWFWNGKETKPEIDRQLHLASEAGLDGMAIHSRTGNQIPYLSDTWLDLVHHACSTARDLGLQIWLYDEDGYPSGTVGNRIQSQFPDLTQRYLTFDYMTAAACREAGAETVYCFAPENFRRVDPFALAADRELLCFHVRQLDCYVDTLNPRTAKIFIELTHETYYRHLAEFFGSTITAIYTDDIDSKMVLASGLPWSPVLEKEYQCRYGEALVDLLPWLVEALPGHREIRIRYRRLVQQLFRDNFVVPLNEWSMAHGVTLTGHFSGDEGPQARIVNETGSIMPLQAAEGIPGIDDYLAVMADGRYLSRDRNHHGLYPLPLYCGGASIARQFGAGLYSCECLAGLGWDCPPAMQDRQLLFELAMGVNLFTPHAAYYTVGGPGKKDFPPSFFAQQPYWPYWAALLKKWKRSAELLLRGRYKTSVLVLHPTAATWMSQAGDDIIPAFQPRIPLLEHSALDIEAGLAETLRLLLRQKVGFDLGDDVLLAEQGTLADGKLCLGHQAYDTVIVMPSMPLLPETQALLERFKLAGGRIIDDRQARTLLPTVALFSPQQDDLAEIMVHARDNQGFTELFLLNLSDQEKSLALTPEQPFCIYDAANDEVVWRGNTWPDDFVLPAWSCCHVLPIGFAENKGYKELTLTGFSRFAASRHTALTLVSIQCSNDNTALLLPASPEGKTFVFECTAPIRLNRIFGEGLHGSVVLCDDRPLLCNGMITHPCDHAYEGYAIDLNLTPGRHRIAVDQPLEVLYLNGDFRVACRNQSTVIAPASPLRTGNLAVDGLPFYWGNIIYEFKLDLREAPARGRLCFNAGSDAVRVVVNNQCNKILTGPDYVLEIGGFLHSGGNTIRLVLANTAQNFIAPFRDGSLEPAAFGLASMPELLT